MTTKSLREAASAISPQKERPPLRDTINIAGTLKRIAKTASKAQD